MAKSPFEKRLQEMLKAAEKLNSTVPMVISQVARDEFDLNFRDQGLRTEEGKVEAWKPRQDPYRTPASRAARRRSILVKSGELRRSFKLAPKPGMAVVQNTTPYARIHNRGGRMRGQMRAWATNRRSRKTRLRPSGSPAYMPARPFMVTTPLLLKRIEEAVHEEVVKTMAPK